VERSEAECDEEDRFPRPGVRWQTAEDEEMRAVARLGQKAFKSQRPERLGALTRSHAYPFTVAFQRRPGRCKRAAEVHCAPAAAPGPC
jgi:hypothetical protein